MDATWCQNVTQDGSFHGTKDGVCGCLSDGVCSVGRSVRRSINTFRRILDEFQEAQDDTYVGTLDGLYQHTLIATGTRLRPLEAPVLGYILGTKPAKNMRV